MELRVMDANYIRQFHDISERIFVGSSFLSWTGANKLLRVCVFPGVEGGCSVCPRLRTVSDEGGRVRRVSSRSDPAQSHAGGALLSPAHSLSLMDM